MLIHVDPKHGTARVLSEPLGLITETGQASLRECREAAGLSQAQAAEMAGCSRNYWAQIERGDTRGDVVSLGVARSICRVLQRHIDNVKEFSQAPECV